LNHEAATGRFPACNQAPLMPKELSSLGRVAPGSHPEKWYSKDGVNYPNNDGYSWMVKLLPYVEENLLYDQIATSSEQFQSTAFQPSVKLPIGPVAGAHASSASLPMLICPSFRGETTAQDAKHYGLPANNGAAATIAGGNYVAMAAATRGVRQKGYVDDLDPKLGGVLNSKGCGIREITDGTSMTILITESKHEKFSSWYSGQSSWVIGFHPDQAPTLVQTELGNGIAGVRNKPNTTSLNQGRELNDNAGSQSNWYATELEGGNRDWGPSSDHGAGVIIHSYADGHVQAIEESIDPTVYFRMITRAGGERLP
jgi:hypothetical protein